MRILTTCSASRGPGLALVVVASVLVVDIPRAALAKAQTVIGCTSITAMGIMNWCSGYSLENISP